MTGLMKDDNITQEEYSRFLSMAACLGRIGDAETEEERYAIFEAFAESTDSNMCQSGLLFSMVAFLLGPNTQLIADALRAVSGDNSPNDGVALFLCEQFHSAIHHYTQSQKTRPGVLH